MSNTALILLAAGSSSRMGQPKQLLKYKGKPLIRHTVEVALQSACRPVFVVLGANAELIRPALHSAPVIILENTLWPEGMGTSIQCGIRAAQEAKCAGAILTLADQPSITASTLDLLVESFKNSGKQIVASRYSGTLGVPVYFRDRYFPDLLALKPPEGCKGLILANREDCLAIDCPEAADDIDTPADWERLQQS